MSGLNMKKPVIAIILITQQQARTIRITIRMIDLVDDGLAMASL